MQATTIKIEDPLLENLKGCLPTKTSLTAFVKEILEQEIQRRKMIQSAEQYAEFLQSNSKEKEWLEKWEAGNLETAPKASTKRKLK